MKTLILTIAILFSVAAKANNEAPKVLNVTNTENTVKVETNIKVKANETYLVKKIVGKNVCEIAMIMGTEETESFCSVKFTDAKKCKAKKATYQIVKVNVDNTETVVLEQVVNF